MTISVDDIKNYLSENKESDEVKSLLGEVAPKPEYTSDGVDKFIESNEDYQKRLQSERDMALDARLKKFMGRYANEEGNLEAIIERRETALRQELNPEETEVEKRLRESEERVRKLEAGNREKDLLVYTADVMAESKIPDPIKKELLRDLVKIGDEEKIKGKVKRIQDAIENSVKVKVAEILKTNSRDIPDNQPNALGDPQAGIEKSDAEWYAERRKKGNL